MDQSKIIDTLETYHTTSPMFRAGPEISGAQGENEIGGPLRIVACFDIFKYGLLLNF